MASNATKRMRREQDALCSDTNANTIMISSTILASDDSKDFSSFPHDILSHILSFLPTKDAVATSALSKRWKHLWKSVNNLDFDDRLFRSPELENKPAMKNCFVKFVDSVLRGLSRPTIDRFSLRLHNCIYHPSPLDAWITAISGLGLRKLSITYDFSDMEDDPLNLDPLFNYSSLVELELAMMITIGFPSSTSLSNLKVLKIYLMDIVSQSKEMVLSFPVLKVFRADCCSWLSIRDVILEAPMLETVIIIHIFIVENRSIDVFSEEQQKTAIKIVAPCLKNFVYLGFAIEEIILSNPLSVVNVFLEINEMKKSRWGEVGDRVCKLLKGFQRMEDLKLGPTAVEMITHADDYVSKLPVLPCLVSLVTDVDNYLPSQEFLLNLLHKLPILERLELCSGFERFDNDLFPSAVPECLLSTLKIVKINFFMWSEVEICLAKYMLENSRVLEELNITIKIETTVSMEKVKHDLLSFNRASRILSVKVEMTKPEDLWDFDSYCIHSNGGIQLVYE